MSRKRIPRSLALASLFVLLLAASSPAQWPTSPDERLVLGYGIETESVSDGNGGAFVAFMTNLAWPQNYCFFQRVNREGYPQFAAPIYLDSGVGFLVFDFHAVTDGQGGAIIGILELCGEDPNWYGRLSLFRYDHEGENIYWNLSVNASGAIPEYDFFYLVPDSAGGVYVGYVGYGAVRIQHIGPLGERLWGNDGIDLEVNGPAWPEPADLTVGADGNHCFATLRGDTLYAFKFTPEGEAVWGDGIMIPDLGHDTELAPDGTGGFVEIYKKYVGPYQNDLIASRIDSEGNAAWGNEGIYIGNISFDKSILCHYPYIYIMWDQFGLPGIAQLEKLDYQGNRIWPEGLTLFSATLSQGNLHMVDTGTSGLIFFCLQNNPGTTTRLVAQKYSYEGERLWNEDGVFLSSRDLGEGGLDVTHDESGGGIFSWYESDPTYGPLVCAAMVNSEGDLGVVGIKGKDHEALVVDFTLLPCFPNPFNASTTLTFTLPIPSYVKLDVFDIAGRIVGAGLKPAPTPGSWYPPGVHKISFDGSDLPSGIYIYHLQAGDFEAAGKMVLMK